MKINIVLILLLGLVISCTKSNEETSGEDKWINSFKSFKEIYGRVNGVWKSNNNPYIISDEVYIENGDTLIIDTGVVISNKSSINVLDSSVLILRGSAVDPVILSGKKGGYYSDNNGWIYLEGHLIAINSIIVGGLEIIPVNRNSSVNLNYVTWIMSIINVHLQSIWRIEHPNEKWDYVDTISNVYALNLNIKNSIISSFPNVHAVNLYWLGIKEGIVDESHIIIDSNCISDFTKQKVVNLFSLRTKSELIIGNDWKNGNNIIREIEFEKFPMNDGRDSMISNDEFVYDANSEFDKYNLHIPKTSLCSAYGAYN